MRTRTACHLALRACTRRAPPLRPRRATLKTKWGSSAAATLPERSKRQPLLRSPTCASTPACRWCATSPPTRSTESNACGDSGHKRRPPTRHGTVNRIALLSPRRLLITRAARCSPLSAYAYGERAQPHSLPQVCSPALIAEPTQRHRRLSPRRRAGWSRRTQAAMTTPRDDPPACPYRASSGVRSSPTHVFYLSGAILPSGVTPCCRELMLWPASGRSMGFFATSGYPRAGYPKIDLKSQNIRNVC